MGLRRTHPERQKAMTTSAGPNITPDEEYIEIDLSDDQLSDVAGGFVIPKTKPSCPACGCKSVTYHYTTSGSKKSYWKCLRCNHTWPA